MIKIIVFYYRDNSKFLDITVYYVHKNKCINLVPRAIMEQDMRIRMSLRNESVVIAS